MMEINYGRNRAGKICLLGKKCLAAKQSGRGGPGQRLCERPKVIGPDKSEHYPTRPPRLGRWLWKKRAAEEVVFDTLLGTASIMSLSRTMSLRAPLQHFHKESPGCLGQI
jgi:hypothetical protein